jgi:hypothetical protein
MFAAMRLASLTSVKSLAFLSLLHRRLRAVVQRYYLRVAQWRPYFFASGSTLVCRADRRSHGPRLPDLQIPSARVFPQ